MDNTFYFGQVAKLRLLATRDKTGITGLNVNVSIRRLSDGAYLQNGGASFSPSFAVNSVTEIDSTNERGVYQYNFDQAVDDSYSSGVNQAYLVSFSSELGETKYNINYTSGVAREATLLLTSGALAAAINNISISGNLSSGTVADAVWNALLDSHAISGTFGEHVGQTDIRARFV
jgi:hypothetical protein